MTSSYTLTIGSLCSGYEGIGLALGGQVAYVCDPEPAAALVLKAHHPDAPNHADLKALTWAETPVELLTAGYPCQPFSGAGKRAGTEDPRHLWPQIAQGIALSRPPLILLENVRGHLTLGWDVVLLDLHRLGYDVRWTLVRAADVGAPHGRARLFAVAADRNAHRWLPSARMPLARAGVEYSSRWAVKERACWMAPQDGLFGEHLLPRNEKGTQPLADAGLMVDGIVWAEPPLLGSDLTILLPTPTAAMRNGNTCRSGERSSELLLAGVVKELLPTPAVNDMGKAYTPEQWDAWCAQQKAEHSNGNGHGASLEIEAARLGEQSLLPTPLTSDSKGTGERGLGGLDLRTAIDGLLPTPKARDAKGRDPNPRGVDLNEALALLPTPRATDGSKGGPNQCGSSGDLMLPSAVMPENLLPTPKAQSNRVSRRALVETRQWSAPALDQALELVAGVLPQECRDWSEVREQHLVGDGSRWGRYAAAIARCEVLTRPAPNPTEPTGKKGAQRLSPAFVEWMMMLPEGWVTGHGLKRDQMLKLLGNGVVPPQARAAWQHLTTGLVAMRAAA